MLPELRKVNIPFAIDIIAQKFDNILELIHPNAFVYGGCLRDIIAGFTLEGDLDIVAFASDYDYCYSKIISCGKWRVVHSGMDNLIKKIRDKNPYRSNKAIGNLVSFETFGNSRVDLIKAATTFSGNYLTASLEVVKTVDIVCCGIVMDIYGNAFEVVEGAYQDCVDRILRINNLNSTTSINNLKNRIAKLENRGWTSKINIDKTAKMLGKLEEAAIKEAEKKAKSTKKAGAQNPRYKIITHREDVIILIRNVDSKMLNYDKMDEIVRMSLVKYDCKSIVRIKILLDGVDIIIGSENKDIAFIKKAALFVVKHLKEYIETAVKVFEMRLNDCGLIKGGYIEAPKVRITNNSYYKQYFESVEAKEIIPMGEIPNIDDRPKTAWGDPLETHRVKNIRNDERNNEEVDAPEEVEPSEALYFQGLNIDSNTIPRHSHGIDQIKVFEFGREPLEHIMVPPDSFDGPLEEAQEPEDLFDVVAEKKPTHRVKARTTIKKWNNSV